MADAPDIIIRPFDARKDLKEVQLLVGMGAMEQLAVANKLGMSPVFSNITRYHLRLFERKSILKSTRNKRLVGVRGRNNPSTEPLAKGNRDNRLARLLGAASSFRVHSSTSYVRYRLVSPFCNFCLDWK